MPVTLVERYNDAWPVWFETLQTRLMSKLEGHVLSIEHIGSTSVPGMTAKPIIDLDIVIPDDTLQNAIDLMATLGYFHQGDLGIPAHDAFDLSDRDLKVSLQKHHPYVCPESSPELKRHLAFRDFLRQNPDYVRRLSDLKWEFCERHDNDRQAYMDGKEALCAEIRRLVRCE